MMDARRGEGRIGDVVTFAHTRTDKVAAAAAKPSTSMTASGAAALIAPPAAA